MAVGSYLIHAAILEMLIANANSEISCGIGLAQEFRSLFLFSRRLNLSSLFLCIFSASFLYLSFSSFAVLRSRIACMRLCVVNRSACATRACKARPADLSLFFLLSLQLFLFGFRRRRRYSLLHSLRIGSQTGPGPESFAWRVPLLSWHAGKELVTAIRTAGSKLLTILSRAKTSGRSGGDLCF
jgi:hypothetical protein